MKKQLEAKKWMIAGLMAPCLILAQISKADEMSKNDGLTSAAAAGASVAVISAFSWGLDDGIQKKSQVELERARHNQATQRAGIQNAQSQQGFYHELTAEAQSHAPRADKVAQAINVASEAETLYDHRTRILRAIDRYEDRQIQSAVKIALTGDLSELVKIAKTDNRIQHALVELNHVDYEIERIRPQLPEAFRTLNQASASNKMAKEFAERASRWNQKEGLAKYYLHLAERDEAVSAAEIASRKSLKKGAVVIGSAGATVAVGSLLIELKDALDGMGKLQGAENPAVATADLSKAFPIVGKPLEGRTYPDLGSSTSGPYAPREAPSLGAGQAN